MAAAPPPIAPLALALRLLVPLAGAVAAAWALDALSRRKGLQPPGFRTPWRRAAAALLVVAILWVAIFRPLGDIGLELKMDLTHVSTPELFLLHILMTAAVLVWFVLGFAGVRPARPGAVPSASSDLAPAGVDVAPPPAADLPLVAPTPPLSPAAPPPSPPGLGRLFGLQFGFRARSIPREVGLGLFVGVMAWGLVLMALLLVAFVVFAIGGDKALPKPSAIVPFIAALPLFVRFLVSLSAGVVEETFFRGFLQPRLGIALSTAFFVVAHVSYGQPLMLVGITMLSLIFAFLVRWRQTIWPAMAAHALFDGVQLLVIIPMALKMLGQSAAGSGALATVALATLGW